jgi:hypothetical protein
MITEKTRQLWHIQRLGNKNSTAPKSQEHKNKIRQSLLGRKDSKETIEKKRIAHLKNPVKYWQGRKDNPFLGKTHTEETRQKMSKSKLLFYKNNPEFIKQLSISKQGDKSSFWHGGIWHNPYAKEFTKSYRKQIKIRDNLKCVLCNSTYRLACHHIDYNKNNYNPNNLITLCQYHHSLTNFNRKYWIKYFKIIKKKNKK